MTGRTATTGYPVAVALRSGLMELLIAQRSKPAAGDRFDKARGAAQYLTEVGTMSIASGIGSSTMLLARSASLTPWCVSARRFAVRRESLTDLSRAPRETGVRSTISRDGTRLRRGTDRSRADSTSDSPNSRGARRAHRTVGLARGYRHVRRPLAHRARRRAGRLSCSPS